MSGKEDYHSEENGTTRGGGGSGGGGADLARSISVSLTKEQFEQMYLQPNVRSSAQAANIKTFGNPTPLGVISFLLAFTPTACCLMGWRGASGASLQALIGVYYLFAGIGLYVAGLLELFLGNTFPAVVFCTFGSFWWSFGIIVDPNYGIQAALAADPLAIGTGIAFYLGFWSVYCWIMTFAAIKTNFVFFWILLFVSLALALLSGSYFRLSEGNLAMAARLQVAGGASAFAACVAGYYLFLHLALASVEFPFNVPLWDFSKYWRKGESA